MPENLVDSEPASRVRELLAEMDGEIVTWTGLDAAIIGTGHRFNDGPFAVYDYERLIAALMCDHMNREEAIEFYEFNIAGGWIGDRTPVVISLFPHEQPQENRE